MKSTLLMTQDGTEVSGNLGLLAIAANKLSDYAQLVKLKLSTLVVVTTAFGYLLALRNHWMEVSAHLMLTLIGAFMVVGSANAFNQVLERDLDSLMERTKGRPLPSGRMGLFEAVFAATFLAALGLTILALFTNWLTVLLSSLAFCLYVFAYTPLKRKTEFCSLIGAISGAIPPVMGWTAVRNELSPDALALFALQFLWQFPHFWAIAWLYREDYQKVGFKMLPVKGDLNSVTRQTVYYTLATTMVSLYPLLAGRVSWFYAVGGSLLGIWFLSSALRFHRQSTKKASKNMLMVADIYLPLLLMLWLLTLTR
ncbi:heme o synthase [Fervidibacter sacchari]|uniref:Protoheme IX farnesyltransferase n=1 Tax=Candidatus Fervidibacter sacchari TaxID=1448929 RepID=A0ABT2ELM9_9BACT|nr:heme o synthase [Candidatus Fervidibacter sacchari]MCS3918371.1 protoheme IX farnesyltransferase [Candidatus Fervidibacter sacchari]WKU16159.1 heme o synthase [Candidatus Fervidibacter sacchari]